MNGAGALRPAAKHGGCVFLFLSLELVMRSRARGFVNVTAQMLQSYLIECLGSLPARVVLPIQV